LNDGQDPRRNLVAAHVGFNLSGIQKSSNLALSSVTHGIQSRVGEAVDYFHSGNQLSQESSSSSKTAEHETMAPPAPPSTGLWKESISNPVNQSSVLSMETSSDTKTGFCKDVYEFPV